MVLRVCYIITWWHGVKWANIRDFHLEAVRRCAFTQMCPPNGNKGGTSHHGARHHFLLDTWGAPQSKIICLLIFILWPRLQFLYIWWQGRGCTLPWESTVKTLFSCTKPLFRESVPQTSRGTFIMSLQFSGEHRWCRLCPHVPHMLVWRRRREKLRTEKEAKRSKTVAFCARY